LTTIITAEIYHRGEACGQVVVLTTKLKKNIATSKKRLLLENKLQTTQQRTIHGGPGQEFHLLPGAVAVLGFSFFGHWVGNTFIWGGDKSN